MLRLSCALIAGLGCLTGCILSPTQLAQLAEAGWGTPPPIRDFAPGSISDPNDPALDSPAADKDPIRVRLSNPTPRDADCRVTMELIGREVHFSQRFVPAVTGFAVIGPDQADTVGVEVTFLGGSPLTLDPQILRIGHDFAPGDTIEIVLALPPDEGDGQEEEDEPPPPKPPTIAIEGLKQDLRVNPGSVVAFDVVTERASADDRVAVFADHDADPANGNELPILADAPAADRTNVTWDTTGIPFGRYAIYAELRYGSRLARFGPAPGRVVINAVPTLTIIEPPDGLLVTIGEPLLVEWDGHDPDDNALVSIFLDTDATLNGNELFLAENLAEDDSQARQFYADTSDLKRGSYLVGGIIDDGLASVVVHGPRICMIAGRLGWFSPWDFVEGEISIIEGPNNPVDVNSKFGAAVDASGDVNGDGIADLLIGDPNGFGGDGAGPGAAYYHQDGDGFWPLTLSAADLKVRMIGGQSGARAGQSVTFIAPLELGSNAGADVLIGSPLYEIERGEQGTAYFLGGSLLLSDPNGFFYLEEEATRVTGTLAYEHAAYAVAALGDIDGDAINDVAVGAPGWQSATGRVAVIFGVQGLPSGDLDEVGEPEGIPGFRLLGEQPGDRAGKSVADAGVFNGSGSSSGQSDLLIGAPGAFSGVGKAYLVFGDSIGPQEGAVNLSEIGVSRPGHVFFLDGQGIGGGAVGHALASVDANGDDRPDVLIGAPYFDDGRGRVYLIYNLAGNPLPSFVDLAQIGLTIPGVIFDGLETGDMLGWSVANAGDADADGAQEILLGAPFAGNQAGAAYLIYGGQGLIGSLSMGQTGTCDMQGWVLTGTAPGEKLGYALSAGDLSGDGLPDVAIGAPGFARIEEPTVGRTYLLFAYPTAPPGLGTAGFGPSDDAGELVILP